MDGADVCPSTMRPNQSQSPSVIQNDDFMVSQQGETQNTSASANYETRLRNGRNSGNYDAFEVDSVKLRGGRLIRKRIDDVFEVDSIKMMKANKDTLRACHENAAEKNNAGLTKDHATVNTFQDEESYEELIAPLPPSPDADGISSELVLQAAQKRPRRRDRKLRDAVGEVDSVKMMKDKGQRVHSWRRKSAPKKEAMRVIAQEIIHSFQEDGIDEIMVPIQSASKESPRVQRAIGSSIAEGNNDPMALAAGRTRRARKRGEDIGEVDSIKLASKGKCNGLRNDRKKVLAERLNPNHNGGSAEHPLFTHIISGPPPRADYSEDVRATSFQSMDLQPLIPTNTTYSKDDAIGLCVAGERRQVPHQPEQESSTTNSSEDISLEEIKQCVLEHIPLSLKEKIPAAAWDKIFGKSGQGPPSESSPASQELLEDLSPDIRLDVHVPPEDDDDLSECSDLSGLTSAFSSKVATEVDDIESASSWSFYNIETTVPLSGMSQNGNLDEAKWTGAMPLPSGSPNGQTESESHAGENGVPVPKADNLPATNEKKGSSVVSFAKVQVRYYENILTDNPAVQSGPPIGIGWRFNDGGTLDVDDWELRKGDTRRSADLLIPRRVRVAMLHDLGYSEKQVADMVRGVMKAKNRRKQTVNNLPAAGMEEAIENAKRRVVNLLQFGKRPTK